jgi:hydrogenase maturation protease
MQSGKGHVLVLGLGNDILTDDAIGLMVARAVQARLDGDEAIDVRWTTEMGLSLLDEITDYRSLILVDAAQTGRAPAGYLHEWVVNDLHVLPSATPHFLGIGETLTLGRLLGLPMPDRVRIFGVEVEDMRTLGTQLTATLARALPGLIDAVLTAARAERQRQESEPTFAHPGELRADSEGQAIVGELSGFLPGATVTSSGASSS